MGAGAEAAVSVFILVALVVQWCWDLPGLSRLVPGRVRVFLRRAGFGHTWRMFTPRPVSGRRSLTVELEHPDGEVTVVAFPPARLGRGDTGALPLHARKLRGALIRSNSPRLRQSYVRWLVDEVVAPETEAGGRPWARPVTARILVEHRPHTPWPGSGRLPPPRRARSKPIPVLPPLPRP